MSLLWMLHVPTMLDFFISVVSALAFVMSEVLEVYSFRGRSGQ